MKKMIVVLVIVLVLTFAISMAVSAKKPEKLSGFFYFVPPYGENDYCISTGDGYVSNGFLDGCVNQSEKPGIGQHGTIALTMQGVGSGTCAYNLRAYDNDGIARFVANRCSGDLAGFHMKAVGWASNGLWEGSYHFDP